MSAVIKLCAAVVRQQVGRDDAEAEAWRLSALGAREEYDQLRRERDEFKAEAKVVQPSVWQPHEPVDRTSYVVSLESELTSTKAALIDAALIHAKLIQERDELKARLAHAEADSEQAIHNEAFTERQRIVAYIHARLAHATMDDRVSMRERGVMIDLGTAIERGEHSI